jgi:hypothetical protein
LREGSFGYLYVPAAAGNDYPTSETADYVLGCMAANGNTRETLLKCSCSIDFIAKRLAFAQYEKAETALSEFAVGRRRRRPGWAFPRSTGDQRSNRTATPGAS